VVSQEVILRALICLRLSVDVYSGNLMLTRTDHDLITTFDFLVNQCYIVLTHDDNGWLYYAITIRGITWLANWQITLVDPGYRALEYMAEMN
jgi:hypothetical protein